MKSFGRQEGMERRIDLDEYCATAAAADPVLVPCGETVRRLAEAIAAIADLIALGPLAGAHGEAVGTNSDGDVQKALDVAADRLCKDALRRAPVESFLSEEGDGVEILNPGAPLAVAIDPLDGSSNIDTNLSIGTIFSIVPAGAGAHETLGPFAATGRSQLAAGFAVYGPRTTMALTLGRGVAIFTLDRRSGSFVLTHPAATIAPAVREFAINASNHRHWDKAIRIYIDDCVAGTEGPRGQDFNMRWNASLVAEVYRILVRGGLFLYPSDARPGYENGRLRLIYEARPMAFLAEQAGGMASSGRVRILDIEATAPHQRIPLILGSPDKVERIEALYAMPDLGADDSPLFARRGLFRN